MKYNKQAKDVNDGWKVVLPQLRWRLSCRGLMTLCLSSSNPARPYIWRSTSSGDLHDLRQHHCYWGCHRQVITNLFEFEKEMLGGKPFTSIWDISFIDKGGIWASESGTARRTAESRSHGGGADLLGEDESIARLHFKSVRWHEIITITGVQSGVKPDIPRRLRCLPDHTALSGGRCSAPPSPCSIAMAVIRSYTGYPVFLPHPS